VTYGPRSLPSNDNVNPKSFCVDVTERTLIRKGKMIAYYGSLRFETLGSGPFQPVFDEALNSVLYANDFVVVTGTGKLILGDRGRDIASFDLEDGNLTVRSTNVLGFDPSLRCRESVIGGYLSLTGTGRFLASSNGPAHFLEPPVRVDEDALLGWADLPSPSYHYDHNYLRGALRMMGAAIGGRRSGEEKQLDFEGSGTVLIQSSERGAHR
jgi:uncharacterized protein (AIM24 family)